jgi:hypothetical protein
MVSGGQCSPISAKTAAVSTPACCRSHPMNAASTGSPSSQPGWPCLSQRALGQRLPLPVTSVLSRPSTICARWGSPDHLSQQESVANGSLRRLHLRGECRLDHQRRRCVLVLNVAFLDLLAPAHQLVLRTGEATRSSTAPAYAPLSPAPGRCWSKTRCQRRPGAGGWLTGVPIDDQRSGGIEVDAPDRRPGGGECADSPPTGPLPPQRTRRCLPLPERMPTHVGQHHASVNRPNPAPTRRDASPATDTPEPTPTDTPQLTTTAPSTTAADTPAPTATGCPGF